MSPDYPVVFYALVSVCLFIVSPTVSLMQQWNPSTSLTPGFLVSKNTLSSYAYTSFLFSHVFEIFLLTLMFLWKIKFKCPEIQTFPVVSANTQHCHTLLSNEIWLCFTNIAYQYFSVCVGIKSLLLDSTLYYFRIECLLPCTTEIKFTLLR